METCWAGRIRMSQKNCQICQVRQKKLRQRLHEFKMLILLRLRKVSRQTTIALGSSSGLHYGRYETIRQVENEMSLLHCKRSHKKCRYNRIQLFVFVGPSNFFRFCQKTFTAKRYYSCF